MTELQQTEFNILKEFVSVCERLRLTCEPVCGSAVGAVKYKGFIPWDDDVDVALPRRDYAVFCEKAQKLLPTSIFLQTNITDPKYPNIFRKAQGFEYHLHRKPRGKAQHKPRRVYRCFSA